MARISMKDLDDMNKSLHFVLKQTFQDYSDICLKINSWSVIYLTLTGKDGVKINFSIVFAMDKNRTTITTGEILLRSCEGPENICHYFRENYEDVHNFQIDQPGKEKFASIIELIEEMICYIRLS
jgi:hypothetical protein